MSARHARGQPVLIGTRSVEASEHLSQALTAAGIAHQELNARQDKEEADIVERAGRKGMVTVATNMAGRGTDIKINNEVRALGGLHVILTEYHESSRIDRQLFGRSGRQGDPGSAEGLASLEDELFKRFLTKEAGVLRAHLAFAQRMGTRMCRALVRLAQWRAENWNALVRKQCVQQDKRLEKQ